VAINATFLPWVLQMGHIQSNKYRISGKYKGQFAAGYKQERSA